MGGFEKTGTARDHSATLDRSLSKLESLDRRRAGDVEAFFNDFEKSVGAAAIGLKDGKKAVFVTGNRTVKARKIPMDVILAELAEPWFVHDRKHDRVISHKRLPARVRQGTAAPVRTMHEEHVTVLTKR